MTHLFASHDLHLHADFADLFELLSISLNKPTQAFACALADGSYFSDLTACLQGISSALDAQHLDDALAKIADASQAFASLDTAILYHQINLDFTRLFVSPKRELIPLYESLIVHRDDKKASMFINPTCMHAEQVYRKSGFPFPEKNKTPGDHVAIELRYVAFLISQRIAGLQADNPPAAQQADALLQAFIKEHLLRWYQPFMLELSTTAAHPFYLVLARIGLLLVPMLSA